MSKVRANWEAFLDPSVLRERLISASLYLAAYELLVDSIVEHIRSFFTNGFDEKGPLVSDEYKKKVLHQNTSPVYASLAWLKQHDVLDDNDLKDFERIKECRNAVAHELPTIVGGTSSVDYAAMFPVMVALIRKIEVWWIVNVEVPTNPDYDGRPVDEAGIVPGPVMMLQLMLEIVLGEPDKANYYLHEFRKHHREP